MSESNTPHNINLYRFYATFDNETEFRQAYDNMTQQQRDYYFPTFDHYLDAINFANGEYCGSTYIPDCMHK